MARRTNSKQSPADNATPADVGGQGPAVSGSSTSTGASAPPVSPPAPPPAARPARTLYGVAHLRSVMNLTDQADIDQVCEDAAREITARRNTNSVAFGGGGGGGGGGGERTRWPMKTYAWRRGEGWPWYQPGESRRRGLGSAF